VGKIYPCTTASRLSTLRVKKGLDQIEWDVVLPRLVTVGLVHFKPRPWEVDENWNSLKGVLSGIKRPLDIVITPECVTDGYSVKEASASRKWQRRGEWVSRCALPASSSVLREASELSRQLSSYLLLGFSERAGEDLVYNSVAVFSRSGRRIGTYRKTHLQHHDLQFAPGRSWLVVNADFGHFGVVICADRRWPEAVRCQRLLGAEVLAIPSFGMSGSLNTAMLRTSAYENGFYVAFAHPARSVVAGPDGELILDVESDRSGVETATLDLEAVEDSHLRDRRIDLYKDVLCRPTGIAL